MISLNGFHCNDHYYNPFDIYLFSIKIKSYSKWKNKQKIYFFHLKINIYENQIPKFIDYITSWLYVYVQFLVGINYFIKIIVK